MKIHALRLLPGEDLKTSILQFSKDQNIGAGAIVTCVGSVKQYALRMAGAKESLNKTEKMEIVSLVGTFGSGTCHLHLSLSDAKGTTIGGHMQEGCLINTTAEIVLMELKDRLFLRETDEQTGYKELLIKKITE